MAGEIDQDLIDYIFSLKAKLTGEKKCDGEHEGVCLDSVPEMGLSLMSKDPMKDGFVVAIYNDEENTDTGPVSDLDDLLELAVFIGHISTGKALRLAESIITAVVSCIPSTPKEIELKLRAQFGKDATGVLEGAAEAPPERINTDRGGGNGFSLV